MSLHSGDLYEFGPFRLEPAERRLLRDGEHVPLPPKAFDVLVALVSRAGHLVSKEDLLKEVWPDTFVEEASLSYTVSLLRKALQAGAGQVRYIDTVQKLGYRFTSPVRTVAANESRADIEGPPPASPSTEQEASTTAVPAVERSRRWPGAWSRQRATTAIGVLGLIAAAVVVFRYAREVPPAPVEARFDETVPGHIILTDWDHPVMSPDGRRVAFTGVSEGRRQLWVRPLRSSAPIPLPGTEGAIIPFWSPDSKSLAFFAHRKLKTIDVERGQPIEICCDSFPIGHTFGGAWGSSGVILFSNGPIYRVRETGGAPERVTTLDMARHERWHQVVGFLSDARRFVFTSDPPPITYLAASLDDPKQRYPLSLGAAGIDGLSIVPGHFLYAREGVVVAQPFDEQTLTPRGAPLTLAHTDAAPWQPRPSASRTGIVVFRSKWYTTRQLAWRGRDGTLMGVIGDPDVYTAVDLSPTGTRAVVVKGGSGWVQNRDLWLVDLTTRMFERLTTHPGLESSPAWSPEGGRIAYHSSQTGVISPFVMDPETRGEQQLLQPKEGVAVDDWTGNTLVLRTYGGAVYALPVAGERKLQPLTDSTSAKDQLQVSPDGQWIAFNSDESKEWEVYVARFPEFTDQRRISVAGGVQPKWRGDSRELFYLAPDGTMMAGPPDRSSPARRLFKTLLSPPSHQISEFDVSSNGQRFLVLEPASTGPQTLTYLLNWNHAE